MSIVVPNHLGTWKLFRNRFVKPIESGNVDRLQDLKFLLNPFLKRRVKEEVTPDLPAKIEINDIIPLSLFERDTYDQIRQQAQSILKSAPSQAKFQVLPLLTKLRQICCHRGLVISSASDHSSKLDRAMEILEQINQGNRKVLIFSQFVQLLQKMKERIIERNWEYCYLDGSTSTNQRQIEIERFQEGTPKIFLISLKAGGSGINLTQATEVIHLDPWWNPAIEDQASDRAHRIGQTQTVTVIRLLAEDTIETQILRLQQEKRAIANNILGDNLSSLTLDELSEILS
jgi:SNF2 family DNA or RNA helicase